MEGNQEMKLGCVILHGFWNCGLSALQIRCPFTLSRPAQTLKKETGFITLSEEIK